MGPRPASSAHSPWPPRPAAARCVIRAFRAEDRLSLARPQPDAGEREPGLGSAAGKELAREEEEDGIVWLRSALGPAERSPGPRARCARGPQSPAAPASGGVCPALPCSLVRIEGRGGREPRAGARTPRGPSERALGAAVWGHLLQRPGRRGIYTGAPAASRGAGVGDNPRSPSPCMRPRPPPHTRRTWGSRTPTPAGLRRPLLSRGIG